MNFSHPPLIHCCPFINCVSVRATVGDATMEGTKNQVGPGQGSQERIAGKRRRMEGRVEEQQASPNTMKLVKQPTKVPLQELVNVCHTMLKGTSIPPTRHDVSFICDAMDKIRMFHIGLTEEIGFFVRNLEPQNPPILMTWKAIYKCPNKFTIAVLYLPRGAAMPLHDHQGMTVFTKLLAGSAHTEAYDWVRPCIYADGPGSEMLAKKVREGHLTARSAAAWALLPDSGGDMNRLVAGKGGSCVFLKVCAPLYSTPEQQLGAFYKHSPYKLDLNVVPYEALTEERKSRLVWARKICDPKDAIKIACLRYRGPPTA